MAGLARVRAWAGARFKRRGASAWVLTYFSLWIKGGGQRFKSPSSGTALHPAQRKPKQI